MACFIAEASQSAPLSDAVVLIIRHAEKPASGRNLSPAGEVHARWYARYFTNYVVDGQPLKLDSLFAAHDSKNSSRPRLTLEPVAKALKLALNCSFSDKEPAVIAEELKSRAHGHHILICWHHGAMGDLVQELGADRQVLLPNGEWPAEQFGWVLELHYDSAGHIIGDRCKRVVQPPFE